MKLWDLNCLQNISGINIYIERYMTVRVMICSLSGRQGKYHNLAVYFYCFLNG